MNRLAGFSGGCWWVLGCVGLLAQEDSWVHLPQESRPSLVIEAKVGESPFQPGHVSATQETLIRLRVVAPEAVTSVRWFQIVPDTARYYKNANHPWEPDAYKWVGFGRIDYVRIEVGEWRDKAEIDVRPSTAFERASHSPFYRADLGSFWLQVEILSGEKRLRSPGLAENDERNLSPDVFRISLRRDDSSLGYLTGFFNVPGLFGSVPYQSHHYIGVDCADVLVAANRRWRGLPASKDYNVSMLVDDWKRVAECRIVSGEPDRRIKWNDAVRPGDAIAVRYTPGKAYMHIGALYEDANHNGVLDPADEVIHAGPEALHISRLRDGGFDGEIVILRPPG